MLFLDQYTIIYKRSIRCLLFAFTTLILGSCGNDTSPKIPAATDEKAQNTTTSQDIYRPKYHFTPPKGWMKSPNGLIYHADEYHLFYEYSPNGNPDGPLHWGHAVSQNFTHWQHLPIALSPDESGGIAGGSTIMDYDNTSGFAKDEKSAMVSVYTYANKNQSATTDQQQIGVAYSTDNGRSWTKYDQKVELTIPRSTPLKDPKVVWYAPDKTWVMLLAAPDRMMIYRSKNLKEWTFASEFGADQGSHAGLGIWTKPDLFYLPYEGVDEKGGQWVLLASINKGPNAGGSATQYFLGDFDGKVFKNSLPKDRVMWLDLGKDYTGAVSWSGAPIGDSRRIVQGWMSNEEYAQKVPSQNWQGMLSLTRTLRLYKESYGARLDIQVSKENRSLNVGAKTLPSFILTGEKDLTAELGIDPQASIILLDFASGNGQRPLVGIEFSNDLGEKVIVDYDFSKGAYAVDRSASGKVDFAPSFAGKNIVRTGNTQAKTSRIFIFQDVSSIEVFTEKNNLAMTNLIFPTQPYNKVKVFSKNGSCNVQVRGMGMRSVWN